jgi:sensor histidine kinase regulating citrate/malate metabolism
MIDQGLETTFEQLAATLQSASDGVIVTDIHGRVEFLNSTAECLTGITHPRAVPSTKFCAWKRLVVTR